MRKKNFLCLVTGPTGSGKSWSCLSIALMLDKKFNASRIVFGLRGLMNLINSDEKFPAGTVFIWDELQVEASSRDWQSLSNKLLNSLLSTFRHRNFVLLLNSPYADFVDTNVKKLLHAEFETQKIDYKTEKTKLKPLVLQYNARRRQHYYKYLRVKTARGLAPVKSWSIPKPPKWLIDDYEDMKHEFTSNLNVEIEAKLEALERKEGNKPKPLTEKQQRVMDLLEKYDGDTSKVAEEMNITTRAVYFHTRLMKNKGYKPRTTLNLEAE